MHVSCENCEASFSLQEREAPPEGFSVRCTVCQHVFRVGPGVPPHEDLGWQIRTSDDLLFTASDVQTLRQWANEGRLQQDDQVSRTGQTWIRLGDLPQMTSVFQPTPAAILTPPPAFGGTPPVGRAPTLHSYGQQHATPAVPSPPAPVPSPSGSFPVVPGGPGSARAPTVLTRPGSGSFPVLPPRAPGVPVAPAPGVPVPTAPTGTPMAPMAAPNPTAPSFAAPTARVPGRGVPAAPRARPPFTPVPPGKVSDSGSRAVLRPSSPFVPVESPRTTSPVVDVEDSAASGPRVVAAAPAVAVPGLPFRAGEMAREAAPEAATPAASSPGPAAGLPGASAGVPQNLVETPSGIAADADLQLSRAFTDDDEMPLDSGETPRAPSLSASSSQLDGNAPADDASLNAMVTDVFGEEKSFDDNDDEDPSMEAEVPDEADAAVARVPSVSTILGTEPQPRPQSQTQQVRLEEEELFNDLEDDLLDEFEDTSGGGKKVLGVVLLLGLAGCVSALLVPSVNQSVRAATGAEIPLLLAKDASTTPDGGTVEPVGVAAETGTDGATADTGTTGTGSAEGSTGTGGTGGDTTGTAGGETGAPIAEAVPKKPAPKKTTTKTTTSTPKKKKKKSSGGGGALVDKGCRYVSQGNLSKGISTLRKAFDRNPRDLDVLTCLGDGYRKKGNSRQARHYYDMALRINKRYRPALSGKEKL